MYLSPALSPSLYHLSLFISLFLSLSLYLLSLSLSLIYSPPPSLSLSISVSLSLALSLFSVSDNSCFNRCVFAYACVRLFTCTQCMDRLRKCRFTAAVLISRHDVITLDRDTNVQHKNYEVLSFRTEDQVVRTCTPNDIELCDALSLRNTRGPFAACRSKRVCYWSCTA